MTDDDDTPKRVVDPAILPSRAPQRPARADLPRVMTPAMIREVQREAWLEGFATSGREFNGETVKLRSAPAVQRLLRVAFDRWFWSRRDAEDE